MGATLLELRALQIYAPLMERQAADADALNARPGLPHVPDGGLAVSITEAAALQLVPEVMRRSLILSLHSVLESGLLSGVRILDNLRDDTKPFKRSGLRAAIAYLRTTHELDVLRAAGDERAVWVLHRLRNALLHAAGSRFTVQPRLWKELEGDLRQFGDFELSRNRIQLGEALFRRLYEPTFRMLLALVAEVKEQVDRHATRGA